MVGLLAVEDSEAVDSAVGPLAVALGEVLALVQALEEVLEVDPLIVLVHSEERVPKEP